MTEHQDFDALFVDDQRPPVGAGELLPPETAATAGRPAQPAPTSFP